MKSLRDDSLPIDVTRDDPIHRQGHLNINNYAALIKKRKKPNEKILCIFPSIFLKEEYFFDFQSRRKRSKNSFRATIIVQLKISIRMTARVWRKCFLKFDNNLITNLKQFHMNYNSVLQKTSLQIVSWKI